VAVSSGATTVVASVTDNGDGTYEAKYIQDIAGVYQLSITLGILLMCSHRCTQHIVQLRNPSTCLVYCQMGKMWLMRHIHCELSPRVQALNTARWLGGTHHVLSLARNKAFTSMSAIGLATDVHRPTWLLLCPLLSHWKVRERTAQ
jgi:hypothetical protein